MNIQVEALRAYSEPEHTIFIMPHSSMGEVQVGVIYCDPGVDYLDDHCEQCRDEILPFVVLGPSEELSKYLVVSVGERKFGRIKAVWRGSNGLDLNRVNFITD